MQVAKPSRPLAVALLIAAVAPLVPRCASPVLSPGKPEDAWQAQDPAVRATNHGVAFMERYEFARAVEAFEHASILAPDSAETTFNLAVAIFNRAAKGDLEKAEGLLDGIVGQRPGRARALYLRGIMHQYRGKDEQAAECFEQVLKIHPRDACAWYLLARSKGHLGQPRRTELERAISENPYLASAYYDLMRVAVLEGKQDEARALQEKFVGLRKSPLAELVVVPHYRQMGPLAVVRPLSAPPARSVTSGELSAAASQTSPVELGWGEAAKVTLERTTASFDSGMAMADVNGDGRLDLAGRFAADGGFALLLGQANLAFSDATRASGLKDIHDPNSCAFGDYDNDGKIDLFVSCLGPNRLFRGHGDGTFDDVTSETKTAGPAVLTVAAIFLDADHDADLDIYVCNSPSAQGGASPPNQLLNNNGDGTFTDIAASAGVACADEMSVMVSPADLDGDRDTDLVVFNMGGPARAFFNDRLGKYHPQQITARPIRDDHRGVLQDFNGDGRPDLLSLSARRTDSRLFLSGATAMLEPSPQFDECLETLATWGDLSTTRVADLDLDGDLDIAFFGEAGHVLLNDGRGQFVARPNLWPKAWDQNTIAIDLADLTGDGLPDLLRITTKDGGTVEVVPTALTPPANWLALTPTGHRGADQRTRSPASGFGTRVELRCGMHSQVITYTGLAGGLSQSHRPLIFGLNGAEQADYLTLTWPDGVTQCEIELTAGTHHRISETERRTSSCPVLFAWNGERFEFVGDFAGVGGLGYFVAPGQYAAPQVLEQVKIEADQLVPRNGLYELRICEPMEEVAYLDRLELLAIDHPRELSVYPDERLFFSGPPPTHRLLCPANPIFPVMASGPDGADCTDRLAAVDRLYAYQPRLDRRFVGFCRPHTLVLNFSDRPADLEPGRDVYLFLTGSIEYPYSQTTFAAAQAGVTWQPLKIERQTEDGRWETIVPDAGAPGGMGRTIAIDLTGKLPADKCVLRISTNLEIYYDQAFIAADHGPGGLAIRSLPMAGANLQRLGFPMEYSPDGHHPTIYTYDVIEPTSSFKTPRGAYTRYGPVEALLAEFDDRYVILGTGDEIAVSFDAQALPPPAEGLLRSFILVSHAYCKDMDLYTAEPDTVEPLPFRAMSTYPPTPSEHYPDEGDAQPWHRRWNTRTRP